MKNASVLLLVCESGRRWLDTTRRFAGPFQPHSDESPSLIAQPCEFSRVRARLAGESSVAVLWEVAEANVTQVALAIAQVGVGRPDVLQLIAMDKSAASLAANLSLRLSELSVAGVVHAPEQFPLLARLIRRRFQVWD